MKGRVGADRKVAVYPKTLSNVGSAQSAKNGGDRPISDENFFYLSAWPSPHRPVLSAPL